MQSSPEQRTNTSPNVAVWVSICERVQGIGTANKNMVFPNPRTSDALEVLTLLIGKVLQ